MTQLSHNQHRLVHGNRKAKQELIGTSKEDSAGLNREEERRVLRRLNHHTPLRLTRRTEDKSNVRQKNPITAKFTSHLSPGPICVERAKLTSEFRWQTTSSGPWNKVRNQDYKPMQAPPGWPLDAASRRQLEKPGNWQQCPNQLRDKLRKKGKQNGEAERGKQNERN